MTPVTATPAATAPVPPGGLDAGSLIRGALDLARMNPWTLLMPLALLGAISGTGNEPTYRWDAADLRPDFAWPADVAILVAMGVAFVVAAIFVLAIVLVAWTFVAVATAHVAVALARGEALGLGEAFRRSWRALAGNAWACALGLVLVVLGLVALVVPGIVVMAALLPLAAVIAAESRRGRDAVRRTWEITRGHRWSLFVVLLAGVGASIAASLALGWIPVFGAGLASAAGGAVSAVWVAVGAVFHARTTRPQAS